MCAGIIDHNVFYIKSVLYCVLSHYCSILYLLSQACMEEFQRGGQRMGSVDSILQAALEFDLHQVIKDSRYAVHDNNHQI